MNDERLKRIRNRASYIVNRYRDAVNEGDMQKARCYAREFKAFRDGVRYASGVHIYVMESSKTYMVMVDGLPIMEISKA